MGAYKCLDVFSLGTYSLLQCNSRYNGSPDYTSYFVSLIHFPSWLAQAFNTGVHVYLLYGGQNNEIFYSE